MEEKTEQIAKCGFCAEEIPADATVCPKCGSTFSQEPAANVYQTVKPQASSNNGMGFAIASFVLGILGLIPCCCCVGSLGSILAVVFGFVAKNQMKASGSNQFSWMAVTGIILGLIGLALGILVGAFFMLASFIPNAHGSFNFPHRWY
jgi:hypothetical protein